MPFPPLVDADMVTRKVCAQSKDVVFVRGVLEASEGVAVLFAESGGDLTIASCKSRAAEMDQVLSDLTDELDGFFVIS